MRLRDPLLGVLVEVGRVFGVAPGEMWRGWTWPEVWGVYFALVDVMRAAGAAAGTGSLRCARDDGAGPGPGRAPAGPVTGEAVAREWAGVEGAGVLRVSAEGWKKRGRI